MGGQNHQPCGRYLPESTKLSKNLSLARSNLELANVAIEEVLLAELNGTNGLAEPIIMHLDESCENLLKAKQSVADILAKMDELDFNDLPTLKKLDLVSIGDDLASRNLVNAVCWKEIVGLALSRGYFGIMRGFENKIDSLYVKTITLKKKILLLHDSICNGEFAKVTEENLPGNFKTTFADLYTAWSVMNQEFLASSLLSTELWYAFRGFGSLSENTMIRLKIA